MLSLPLLEFRPVSIGALPQRVHFLVVVRSSDYNGFALALAWDNILCVPATDARHIFICIVNTIDFPNFDTFVFTCVFVKIEISFGEIAQFQER